MDPYFEEPKEHKEPKEPEEPTQSSPMGDKTSSNLEQ